MSLVNTSRRPVELFGLAMAEIEVDDVVLQIGELVLDGACPAGQEARPHPVGLGAEAQVEARRLELPLGEVLRRPQHLAAHELADLLARQEPGFSRQLARAGAASAREIVVVAGAGRQVRGHGIEVHPGCIARAHHRSNGAREVIYIVHRPRGPSRASGARLTGVWGGLTTAFPMARRRVPRCTGP
jgi:hypothetical protein